MQMGKVKLVCYHHRDVQRCNTKTVSCLAPVVCSTHRSMNAQESKAIHAEGPWSHLSVLLIVLVQNKMLQDVCGAFYAPEDLRMLVTECN